MKEQTLFVLTYIALVSWFLSGVVHDYFHECLSPPPPAAVAAPACYAECGSTTRPPELTTRDCAMLGMSRIAAYDGARLSAGHWRLADIIGDIAQDCREAYALVAVSRLESSWNSGAVSHAGACGITQVRACDTWYRDGVRAVECCNEYRNGGHHCRPTCEWLQDTRNGLYWTAQWLRDHKGWDPAAYVGAHDPHVSRVYSEQLDMWLAIGKGQALP